MSNEFDIKIKTSKPCSTYYFKSLNTDMSWRCFQNFSKPCLFLEKTREVALPLGPALLEIVQDYYQGYATAVSGEEALRKEAPVATTKASGVPTARRPSQRRCLAHLAQCLPLAVADPESRFDVGALRF